MKRILFSALYLFFIFSSILRADLLADQFFSIDFDDSMQFANYKKIVSQDKIGLFSCCKTLYQQYPVPQERITQEPTIPLIIHQIWLGSPVPKEFHAYQESWKRYHPEWQYYLWTDQELAHFPLYNRDLYEQAVNQGERSDIVRYEILYRYGGVYVDMDFECLHPFDQLHHYYDFYTGLQPLDTNYVQLGNALIGSRPEHPLLLALIQGLRNSKATTIVAKTGPIFFTHLFCTLAPQMPGRIAALPASFFYPRGYTQAAEDRLMWLKPESFAVHHWAGSWLKKEAFIPRRR